LIAEFCDLINYPYQQQQGQFAVGFYSSVLPVAPPVREEAGGEAAANEAGAVEPGGDIAQATEQGDQAAPIGTQAVALTAGMEKTDPMQEAQPEHGDAPMEDHAPTHATDAPWHEPAAELTATP